ncbi:hypothetical protein Q9189_007528 [Teloschistes chrysophthalmus]
MTAAAGPQSSREPRPNIALPTDGSSQKYMLGDGKDCLNLDLDMDPRCWVALILDEWLPAWLAKTPNCSSSTTSNETSCRSQEVGRPEAWTVTFLREYGARGLDCLHLGSLVCADFPPIKIGGENSRLLAARYEYVKSNIIANAQFFDSWHTALDEAAESTKDTITLIINVIDMPEKDKSGIARNVLLTVLGVALSFIPIVGPEAGFGVLTLLTFNAAIAGVKQVPDVAKKI